MIITDTKTLTGAEIIIETLKNLGVDTIFGYPGGIVLSVYDKLYSCKDIKHYLVRHEQAAVHAAEGYARVTGKCGYVLVTSGPGATNTVTGIANAYLDGYPLVVLTGQVMENQIGKDAFQEVNIIDITKSCTKKNFQVTNVKDLENTLIEAHNIAISGKQGPVVVDLAKNIFSETTEFTGNAGMKNLIPIPMPADVEIINALKAVSFAEKPVIIAGGGVVNSEASTELYEFAKLLNIPVVNTMMGLGTFPQNDENYFGMIGLFGSVAANQILRESDLIFAIGARFNDRISCCFQNNELSRKLVHLDINPDEISRVIHASIPLVGDAKYILAKMISLIKTGDYEDKQVWLQSAQELKNKNIKRNKISDKLHSFEVIEAIYEFTKYMNPIVTTEVGQHQLWTAQNFKFNQTRKFLTSGGSGTMGFGFPAAIGACVANKTQPVICITGDGSLQMNIQELATCVDYNLPVKIMVLNNGYLGMVRQLQERMCEKRYSETKISNPDFVKLADSYGIKGIRVEKAEDIENALKTAYSTEEPFLIDFIIEPLEVV